MLEPTVNGSPYIARKPFVAFHQRTQRWAVMVCHRRSGKTVSSVMDLVTAALSTRKENARYLYISPYREQSKTSAWNYLQEIAFPVVNNPETDIRQSDLSVRLYNGSTVRLFGADNPNALRGGYADGVVLDEYADMKASLWREVVRPMLSDRHGWATFIGTPRGTNEFKRVWDAAQGDPEWFTLMLKASESGILPQAELDKARKDMSDALFGQEYECSFTAAILGAIYAQELAKIERQITSVPYDASALVNTAWDLGIGDSTAIWCWQHIGHEVRIIDFYEAQGEQMGHYLEWLRARPYKYDTCYLPHDARQRQMTGVSREQAVRDAGFGVTVLPATPKEDGINAARALLSRCWFDRDKCGPGLEALRHYRWAYNERMGQLKTEPVHDWASHAADSFSYLAHACRTSQRGAAGLKLPPIQYPTRKAYLT